MKFDCHALLNSCITRRTRYTVGRGWCKDDEFGLSLCRLRVEPPTALNLWAGGATLLPKLPCRNQSNLQKSERSIIAVAGVPLHERTGVDHWSDQTERAEGSCSAALFLMHIADSELLCTFNKICAIYKPEDFELECFWRYRPDTVCADFLFAHLNVSCLFEDFRFRDRNFEI